MSSTPPPPGPRHRFRHCVQVAGVHDRAEAAMLARCGVDLVGLPLRLAVHREDLDDDEAAAVVRALPPPVEAVLITYLEEAGAILQLAGFLGLRIVQLHGAIATGELRALRQRAPHLLLIRSLVIGQPGAADPKAEIGRTAPWVDAYLTDSFDPASGATGATGRRHDWAVSRELAAFAPHPLLLAGGLHPGNVAEAIRTVRPAGVDAHTGLEDPTGRKDPAKVRAFVAAARAAFADRDAGGAGKLEG